MTECRAWWIILLIVVAREAVAQIVTTNDGDAMASRSNEYAYSWTGPNALARSILVERQERLQYNCEREYGNAAVIGAQSEIIQEHRLNPESFKNILVDDLHKLLYCYVPKVACTNWKRVLMIVTGKWPGNEPLEIPADLAHSSDVFRRLSNYTLAEIEERLATYDKLIVVRHPLERLLSAYRNKLEAKREKSAKYFQSRFGKKIIKKYRPNATEESLRNGDDVTFREFVDYITGDSENGTRNEHWRPTFELCQPCVVNYNLVSKYESLVEDATEVLERIGVTSLSFPARPASDEPTSRKLDKYYSSLSYKQLRKLADLYRLDLRLFDYSLEDVLGFSLA